MFSLIVSYCTVLYRTYCTAEEKQQKIRPAAGAFRVWAQRLKNPENSVEVSTAALALRRERSLASAEYLSDVIGTGIVKGTVAGIGAGDV